MKWRRLFALWVPACMLLLPLAGRAEANGGQVKRPVRGWHFVLRAVPLEQAKWMVDTAQQAGFNTVVVLLSDGVALRNAPWQPAANAWSPADLESWVRYAGQHGMTVIPELKFLTHQEKFFQNQQPGLMYNLSTYDPRNEKVYELTARLLDEVLAITRAPAVHIGHDEVAGHKPQGTKRRLLRPGETMLPAELFLADVLKLRDQLRQRGVETWMWGDMLIAADEFPAMVSKALHGNKAGYGKALRAQIPKDIVICDWHYGDPQPDFPSLAAFRQEKFRVLGVTWKRPVTIRNFSRYAAANGAEGMIATTWSHVQRKEWSMVERILRESGAAFTAAFPDRQ